MDSRTRSLLSTLVDEGIEFQFTEGDDADRVRLSLDDRFPWDADILIPGDSGALIQVCVVPSVPPAKRRAVRKACACVDSVGSIRCRLFDGEVRLYERIPSPVHELVFGAYCLARLEAFRKLTEFAVSQMIFALESSLSERITFAMAKLIYHKRKIAICIPKQEESALYREMLRRRLMERLSSLGEIDLTDAETQGGAAAPASPDREREAPAGADPDGSRGCGKERKPWDTWVIPGVLLAVLTLLFIAAQIDWSMSSYTWDRLSFGGIPVEFLIYGAFALWMGVLIPRVMHGRRLSAAGGILCAVSLLYTGIVFLLNNLWRVLEYYAYPWFPEEYPGGVWAAYADRLREDVLYRHGLRWGRYLVAFGIAAFVILAGYAIRYSSLRQHLLGTMPGCEKDELEIYFIQ